MCIVSQIALTLGWTRASARDTITKVDTQPDTSIVREPPGADPAVTDDERRTIQEMMAKGTYSGVMLATMDIDDLFERLQASGADIVQEPIEQDWGARDCAVRDPAGNLIRIQQR